MYKLTVVKAELTTLGYNLSIDYNQRATIVEKAITITTLKIAI
jgi:hypothetical protein